MDSIVLVDNHVIRLKNIEAVGVVDKYKTNLESKYVYGFDVYYPNNTLRVICDPDKSDTWKEYYKQAVATHNKFQKTFLEYLEKNYIY